MNIKDEIKKQAEEITCAALRINLGSQFDLSLEEMKQYEKIYKNVSHVLLERHTKSRSEGFEDAKEQAAKISNQEGAEWAAVKIRDLKEE